MKKFFVAFFTHKYQFTSKNGKPSLGLAFILLPVLLLSWIALGLSSMSAISDVSGVPFWVLFIAALVLTIELKVNNETKALVKNSTTRNVIAKGMTGLGQVLIYTNTVPGTQLGFKYNFAILIIWASALLIARTIVAFNVTKEGDN